MKKYILFHLISLFIIPALCAQDCSVSVDALKGQYKGECKNGKANGQGTATGADTYIGNFKNGYPDGMGKYTWKNGNWYEGLWKNGLFEGQGTLNITDSTKPNGLLVESGIWKKGKYRGKYEKPYIVHSMTNNVSDLNIRKVNNTGSDITLVLKSITGGGSAVGYPHLPKSRLIDIQAVEGRFDQAVPDETSSPVSNQYTFRQVTFPFYAIFSFETPGPSTNFHVEKIGVEFFEDCNWYVQVNIDN